MLACLRLGAAGSTCPEPIQQFLAALMAGQQAAERACRDHALLRPCSTGLPPMHARGCSHLLAFGVAGGGVGLRVVLPLKRALEWLQVVLAEGIRAQVLAGPAAVALGVDAQPAAVLVTWRVSPGREKAFRGPVGPSPGPDCGANWALGVGKDQAPWPQGCGLLKIGLSLRPKAGFCPIRTSANCPSPQPPICPLVPAALTVIRFPLAVTARLGNPQEPIDGVGGAQRIRLRRLWGRHS